MQLVAGLTRALLASFPSNDALALMLALELFENLEEVSLAGDLRSRTLAVVRYFEARSRTLDLAQAAQRHLGPPGNPDIDRLVGALSQSDTTDSIPAAHQAYRNAVLALDPPARHAALQRILPGAPTLVSPAVYMAQLERACAAVGRVEVGGRQVGSAVLVGLNVALTNQHVAAAITDATKALIRFDYASDADDLTVAAGIDHQFAAQWLLAQRPPGPNDPGGVVQPDELDYALVRLASAAGHDDIGSGRRRGFVDIAERDTAVARAEILVVVQYPEKLPLQIAHGRADDHDGDRRRLRYFINTKSGSSGSPVFDSAFALVALHHSSDGRGSGAGRNQGIPIGLVRDDLAALGKMDLVGRDEVV